MMLKCKTGVIQKSLRALMEKWIDNGGHLMRAHRL
jgi:hypothetical protein